MYYSHVHIHEYTTNTGKATVVDILRIQTYIENIDTYFN